MLSGHLILEVGWCAPRRGQDGRFESDQEGPFALRSGASLLPKGRPCLWHYSMMDLICYLDEDPHTVRDLAATLEISKPAISRSLDRLVELNLAKRGPDARYGRSVLVLRTMEGTAFMSDPRNLLVAGHKAAGGNDSGGTKALAPRRAAG